MADFYLLASVNDSLQAHLCVAVALDDLINLFSVFSLCGIQLSLCLAYIFLFTVHTNYGVYSHQDIQNKGRGECETHVISQ